MDQPEPNPAVEEAKQEALARGAAFEELLTSQGWVHLRQYIEGRIKAFASESLIAGYPDMETYQYNRGLVNGLRQMLSMIESDVQVLNEERRKTKDENTSNE